MDNLTTGKLVLIIASVLVALVIIGSCSVAAAYLSPPQTMPVQQGEMEMED